MIIIFGIIKIVLLCVLAILSQIFKEDKVPGLLSLNIMSFTGAKNSKVLFYNIMLVSGQTLYFA